MPHLPQLRWPRPWQSSHLFLHGMDTTSTIGDVAGARAVASAALEADAKNLAQPKSRRDTAARCMHCRSRCSCGRTCQGSTRICRRHRASRIRAGPSVAHTALQLRLDHPRRQQPLLKYYPDSRFCGCPTTRRCMRKHKIPRSRRCTALGRSTGCSRPRGTRHRTPRRSSWGGTCTAGRRAAHAVRKQPAAADRPVCRERAYLAAVFPSMADVARAYAVAGVAVIALPVAGCCRRS